MSTNGLGSLLAMASLTRPCTVPKMSTAVLTMRVALSGSRRSATNFSAVWPAAVNSSVVAASRSRLAAWWWSLDRPHVQPRAPIHLVGAAGPVGQTDELHRRAVGVFDEEH